MSINTEVIPGSPLYSANGKAKPNNAFAYPAIFDLRNKEEFATYQGLTKLELISAMCLQGIMSNCNFKEEAEHTAKCAIAYAKELLKQLEAEND